MFSTLGFRRSRIATLGVLGVVVAVVVAACSSGDATATPQLGGGQVGGQALSANLAAFESLGFPQVISTGSQQLGIWVDGTGSVTVAPDIANLNFGVEARADTVAEARDEAATTMDAVIASLRGNGVADADIKTTSFSIQPITVFREVSRDREREPVIVGYRVSNFAVAKIRDIDAAGGIIDDAAAAGGDAVRINGIGFGVDDPRPIETQARELALEDAIAKAEQIADVTNVILGTPVFISQQGGSPIFARESVAIASFDAAAGAPTPISAGEQEITVRVQVVFAIE